MGEIQIIYFNISLLGRRKNSEGSKFNAHTNPNVRAEILEKVLCVIIQAT